MFSPSSPSFGGGSKAWTIRAVPGAQKRLLRAQKQLLLSHHPQHPAAVAALQRSGQHGSSQPWLQGWVNQVAWTRQSRVGVASEEVSLHPGRFSLHLSSATVGVLS